MIISQEEKYKPRAYTNKLIEGLELGEIDAKELVEELLSWISEDIVQEFAEFYEYVTLEDEEDEDEDSDL